jgi:hypothetical protein
VKFRKKPIIIEATQWFKNGDHPNDGDGFYVGIDGNIKRCEGKIVRYYRHPSFNKVSICDNCAGLMHHHGFIDTLEGGQTVCPGDWIITGIKREYYSCKPDIFEMTYERLPEE